MTDAADRETGTTRPEPPGDGRWPVPQLVVGGVLVLIGLLWLVERAGWVELGITTVFAIGTLAVGISLMVLARLGAHTGLATMGIILAVLTIITALAPVEGFQGGIGDRNVEVTRVADIGSGYDLAMGTLTIDLRPLEGGDDLGTLTARVGVGELEIRVPSDVAIDVEGRAGMGEVEIEDDRSGGIGVDDRFRSPGFDESPRRLVIDAAVFMGRVEVMVDD